MEQTATVAIGGNSPEPENGPNEPKPLPPVAVSCDTEKGSTVEAAHAGRRNPFAHRADPGAVDGAFMEPSGRNPVATSGKWDAAENRSNKQIRDRWQPTATVSQRMVKSMFATACHRLPTIPYL
jgi:hypothetical protein